MKSEEQYEVYARDEHIKQLQSEIDHLRAELSRIKGEYDALKQSMTSLGVLTGDDTKRFQERHDANMKRLDKKDIELPKIDLDDYTIKSI